MTDRPLELLQKEIIELCADKRELTEHRSDLVPGNLSIWDGGRMIGKVCFYEGFATVEVVNDKIDWVYNDVWEAVCSASYGNINFLEKITGFIKQMKH